MSRVLGVGAWGIRKRTYGVHLGKVKLEAVRMALVEGILVEDLDIEVPVAGNAVVTVQQLDARRQTVLVDLRGARRAASVRLPVDRAREGKKRTNLAQLLD